jgi:hypothetical protein
MPRSWCEAPQRLLQKILGHNPHLSQPARIQFWRLGGLLGSIHGYVYRTVVQMAPTVNELQG